MKFTVAVHNILSALQVVVNAYKEKVSESRENNHKGYVQSWVDSECMSQNSLMLVAENC